jgi:hypothetical protein
MGDTANFIDDHEFVVDLCRFSEGIYTEAAIRKKYRLEESDWIALGEDDALVRKIEDEKLRRIRDGSSKRERAQQHVVKAPDVLSGIMLDPNGSAKHKIDAAKTLDSFAANGPQGAPASERFVITINLGGDVVEHYNKSVAIDANDVDPDHIDISTLAAIATNKQGNDGSGQPV